MFCMMPPGKCYLSSVVIFLFFPARGLPQQCACPGAICRTPFAVCTHFAMDQRARTHGARVNGKESGTSLCCLAVEFLHQLDGRIQFAGPVFLRRLVVEQTPHID